MMIDVDLASWLLLPLENVASLLCPALLEVGAGVMWLSEICRLHPSDSDIYVMDLADGAFDSSTHMCKLLNF